MALFPYLQQVILPWIISIGNFFEFSVIIIRIKVDLLIPKTVNSFTFLIICFIARENYGSPLFNLNMVTFACEFGKVLSSSIVKMCVGDPPVDAAHCGVIKRTLLLISPCIKTSKNDF